MFDNLNSVEIFILFTIGVAVFGGIGYACGNAKGRGPLGFLLGFLLGPLGWIVVLLLPREGQRCCECRGVLEPGARRCCHCGYVLPSFRSNPQAVVASGWFVSREGKTEGPFTTAQLRALIASGVLTPVDLAAHEGDQEWRRVGDVLGI